MTIASSEWSALRITSGSTIQSVVSTSLSHLSGPSNGPLILHTLPFPASSAPPRSAHAGLGKLISIVEIVKREFERHQRATWKLHDEQAAKQAKPPTSKGTKRNREDDEASDEQQQEAQKTAETEFTETKKKKRIIHRLYQYNELDCYERLHGHKESLTTVEDKESGNRSLAHNDRGEEEENIESVEDADHDTAQALLDHAMTEHVIRGRKRPRKKHTPWMRVTLSTARLPEYETELMALGNDYTLQFPDKTKRTRSRKRNGHVNGALPETTSEGNKEHELEINVPTAELAVEEAIGTVELDLQAAVLIPTQMDT